MESPRAKKAGPCRFIASLKVENVFSMGLRSGEYAGSQTSRTPANREVSEEVEDRAPRTDRRRRPSTAEAQDYASHSCP